MSVRMLLSLALLGSVVGCERAEQPAIPALSQLSGNPGVAPARVNGTVGAPEATPPAQISYGAPGDVAVSRGAPGGEGGGDVSLDFADTDIREVVAQILGNMLKVNYTIDPAVHGSATLRTVTPLSRAQLLPTLESLLAQNGAAVVQSASLYRVVPANQAASAFGTAGTAGTVVVQLHYASAEDLAKVLQPYVGEGGKIVADAGRNALLISGDPSARVSLLGLVQTFDTDILGRQSYALLPVSVGDVKDFASALQDAMRGQSGGALAGMVRVVPLTRINAVLVVSPQSRYIDQARRVFALIDRARQQTVRSWHVYYLQNSHAEDIAYVLQQAFTPGNVTAQPTSTQAGAQRMANAVGGLGNRFGAGGGMQGGYGGGMQGGYGGGMQGGYGGGGLGGLSAGGISGVPVAGTATGGGAPAVATPGVSPQQQQAPAASTNPLLGPLEGGGAGSNPDTLRIIPDDQNNAVLLYGTQREVNTIEAMLHKIDILPLQVRIDAVIAEVTLNDNLQYGTQFFFKSGGLNGILSNATQSTATTPTLTPSQVTLNMSFPGFFIGGHGLGGAPFAINALQAVTQVSVLSSPELLVLDNQPARLQVGNVVPYLTQSSQSTIVANAPIVNSVNYQQTGVVMEVTPRVNSGGLVTLDIQQDVSEVSGIVTTPGLNSPTFNDRNVSSRVVVQDGQTVGLAGLIRDNANRNNQGIPWLKDVPLLGFLAGTQNNTRERTELLILITPHVMHDQRDALSLTEDLREQLINAAAVPDRLNGLRPSGSPDPGARIRRDLKLQP
jgi:general secretion pathway protein D